MVINRDNLVSITEANQNFSRVARMVHEKGAAVIFQTRMSRVMSLMEFSQVEDEQQAKYQDISSKRSSSDYQKLLPMKVLAK